MDDLTESLNDIAERGRHTREEGIDRLRNEEHPIAPEFRKEQMRDLDEDDQIALLHMTMQSLGGSWNSIHKREAMIHFLCEEIDVLPEEYLDAVRYNAYQLDGGLIDGRVFRDGASRTGLSGGLARALFGDDTEGDGWNGTFPELREMGYGPSEEQQDELADLIPNDLTFTER